MPLNKELSRIEAKIDLLLKKQGMSEKEVGEAVGRLLSAAVAPAPRKLSAEEQQAVDNAPATPVGASGPAETMPRVDATTNAPVTPAAAPHGMGGKAAGDDKPKGKAKPAVNWNS